MKINQTEASALISLLVNFELKDIKKLSQTDRKICLRSIECIMSNKSFTLDLPRQQTFPSKITDIQKVLNGKAQKNRYLRSLILSLFKSILNKFHLRISSHALHRKIDAFKDPFFHQHWDQYAKDHFAKIETNAHHLKDANLFFISDFHGDAQQNLIRQNVIRHFAKNAPEENIVLLEGLEPDDFPKSLGKKKFKIESWENEEHYEKHGHVINQLLQLLREQKSKLDNINALKKNPNKKTLIAPHITELRRLERENNKLKLQEKDLKKLRDQDLVQKVQHISIRNPNTKIFVIAGTNHIETEDYKIVDLFQLHKYAVLIPKTSEKGLKTAERVFKKAIELGNWDQAFEEV